MLVGQLDPHRNWITFEWSQKFIELIGTRWLYSVESNTFKVSGG